MKLLIKPDWSELRDLRNETRIFLEKNSLSKKQVDSLEMVACELTENAIKYGDYLDDTENIDFAVEISKSAVIMEVKHKIMPESTNLQIFDSRIQWIRSFQNPFQAYIERLKYISGKPIGDNESGLGLVRIAYEGRSILDFYLSEDNVLAVSAVYKL